MYSELTNYIKREKEIGKSDNEIKSDLLKAGWRQEDINEAFSADFYDGQEQYEEKMGQVSNFRRFFGGSSWFQQWVNQNRDLKEKIIIVLLAALTLSRFNVPGNLFFSFKDKVWLVKNYGVLSIWEDLFSIGIYVLAISALYTVIYFRHKRFKKLGLSPIRTTLIEIFLGAFVGAAAAVSLMVPVWMVGFGIFILPEIIIAGAISGVLLVQPILELGISLRALRWFGYFVLVISILIFARYFILPLYLPTYNPKLKSPDQSITVPTETKQIQPNCVNEKYGYRFTYPTDWKVWKRGFGEAEFASCSENLASYIFAKDLFGTPNKNQINLTVFTRDNQPKEFWQGINSLDDYIRKTTLSVARETELDNERAVWLYLDARFYPESHRLVVYHNNSIYEFNIYSVDSINLDELPTSFEFTNQLSSLDKFAFMKVTNGGSETNPIKADDTISIQWQGCDVSPKINLQIFVVGIYENSKVVPVEHKAGSYFIAQGIDNGGPGSLSYKIPSELSTAVYQVLASSENCSEYSNEFIYIKTE